MTDESSRTISEAASDLKDQFRNDLAETTDRPKEELVGSNPGRMPPVYELSSPDSSSPSYRDLLEKLTRFGQPFAAVRPAELVSQERLRGHAREKPPRDLDDDDVTNVLVAVGRAMETMRIVERDTEESGT